MNISWQCPFNSIYFEQNITKICVVQVDLKHMLQEPGNNVVAMGIDLTEFYLRQEQQDTIIILL